MKKFLIIILFLLLGLFWLKILYIVPYSNYTITDQTGKVKLKDYPELKEFLEEVNLTLEEKKITDKELKNLNFLRKSYFNSRIDNSIYSSESFSISLYFSITLISPSTESLSSIKSSSTKFFLLFKSSHIIII